MRRLLLLSAGLTSLGVALGFAFPAAAQVEVGTELTDPIDTQTIDDGNPADIVILSAGSVLIGAGQTAITLNSDNTVTNQGIISSTDADNSIGILVSGMVTGDVINSGTINLQEDITGADDDNDGDNDAYVSKAEVSLSMKRMSEQFEVGVLEVVERLDGSVSGMKNMISDLKEQAADSYMMCDAVALAADQSSSNIESSAVAITEMGQSIQDVASQVAMAEQITSDAVIRVDQANATINELDESAKEINSVVQLINDIAKQTNLLALNAMIEATRAGDSGKGFIVVANEVKALPMQTAEATNKIASQ
ncbi:MAG: methyl-accepting chemotaxis protein, partial [Robiginitomaculum sp.]|nr:methyl-accepting chemotaxis protein [Robiginitomaculum sp.]